MGKRQELTLSSAKDIAVFVSPVRQEILAAIGLLGSVTVAELAHHLGRAPTALYHHLAQLVRVGAVAETTRRREDGKAERTYAAAVERVHIGEVSGRAAEEARKAAAAAALRLSARELAQALEDPALRREGSTCQVFGMRAKAWLGAADLRELHGHIRAIETLLRSRGTRRKRARAYSVSVVLAPTGREPEERRKK